METTEGHSIWGLVEPLLEHVERPSRYIDSEWNARPVSGHARLQVALAYPDTYELGMSNQAISILSHQLSRDPEVAVERVFVPWKDMSALMRERSIPLFTLESMTPVSEVDVFGITLPYELTYSNVLELLDLAGIPVRAAQRSDEHPLVIGGGPCSYNPEPMAAFFDAVLIGEGEDAFSEMAAGLKNLLGSSRMEKLAALEAIPGVYVPSAYEELRTPDGGFRGVSPQAAAPPVVRKRVLKDLSEVPPLTCPIVPYMDVVHDRANIEVLRGCTRGCRFCQAGMVYRPVRERSADEIVSSVIASLECTGYEEVSLTSLSSADHSRIDEVARRLRHRLEGRAISISLPSSRVDAFGVDLARLIGTGRKGGLTFAPEAGTQRLRDVINKDVTEEDLLETVKRVVEAGWQRIKLYYMIGLPTETDDDVRAIGEMVGRVLGAAREAASAEVRGNLKITVSVSTLVPKAHTPFQWEAQLSLEEVRRRQALLRETMPRKGVSLSWHDAPTSFLEGLLARGGRELSNVIETAWRSGARFDAWTEEFRLDTWLSAFETAGVDPYAILAAKREPGRPLPWSHISCGVDEEFLAAERERALAGAKTEDCSMGPCSSCGVCVDGIRLVVQGERRG